MLKFFKQSYIAQLVVIVLLIAALWAPVFITQSYDVVEEYPTTPLYNILTNIMGFSNIAMTILMMILFISSVLFFNAMLSVNQLVIRNSSIGAFVVVLCMCCAPIHNEYYPFLIAMLFIMMTMQIIFLIYDIEKPELYLLNAGLFVSLASMFYFPSILLVIWLLISMMILGFREFRLYLIPIVNFIIPYIILAAIFYCLGTFKENFEAYANAFTSLNPMKLNISMMEILGLLIIGALSVLSVMKIKSQEADNLVSTRKKVSVTILLFFFGFVMLFTHRPVMSNGLLFLVAAVLISMALCYVKKTKLIDIVIIVMMLAVIANQYLPLFGINI